MRNTTSNYVYSGGFQSVRRISADKPVFDKGSIHADFVVRKTLSKGDKLLLSLLADRRGDDRDSLFSIEVDPNKVLAKFSEDDYTRVADAYRALWVRHQCVYADEFVKVSNYIEKVVRGAIVLK